MDIQEQNAEINSVSQKQEGDRKVATPTVEELPKSKDITEKSDLIQSLEERNIYDFETNEITEGEKEDLLDEIQRVIDSEEDQERSTTLRELYAFIKGNSYLFSEFSHGTSSDALDGILVSGLLPNDFGKGIYQESNQFVVGTGEGDRGGRNMEQTHDAIFAGVGQGGLGTAIAYAEVVKNRVWNLNYLNEEDLQVQIDEYQMKYDKTNKEIFKTKLDSLLRAKARRQADIPPDFPLLIGFTGSRKYHSVEELPRDNWVGMPAMRDGRQVLSVSGYNGELDSQVMFDDMDQIMPLDISIIACPKLNIPFVQSLVALHEESENKDSNRRAELQGELHEETVPRRNLQIISLEALKELSNFGYSRISYAERATYHRIIDNLAIEKLRELLA